MSAQIVSMQARRDAAVRQVYEEMSAAIGRARAAILDAAVERVAALDPACSLEDVLQRFEHAWQLPAR